MADDPLKAELTAQLARSRQLFSRDLARLREDFDVPGHIKRNFVNHSTVWIGGAAALGWILSKLPSRSRIGRDDKKSDLKEPKVPDMKRPSLLPGVLTLLFSAARPAVTAYARKKIADLASSRQ